LRCDSLDHRHLRPSMAEGASARRVALIPG
jgi:hypothetical protein